VENGAVGAAVAPATRWQESTLSLWGESQETINHNQMSGDIQVADDAQMWHGPASNRWHSIAPH